MGVGVLGNLGEVELLWEELDHVCVSGGCSGGYVALITTVMVEAVIMSLKTWADCDLDKILFDIFKVACRSGLMIFLLSK